MTSPLKRAQKIEPTVQMRPVGRSTKVPLWRKQLEDEGLAVVMRAIESGRKPDEQVMSKEAHAVWRLKEHLWLDKEKVLKTTGTTEAGRVICPRGRRKK